MAKKKPGLPENFEMNVERPVELGDYLDSEASSSRGEGLSSATAQRFSRSKEPAQDRIQPQIEKAKETPKIAKKREKEPPRKQLNMKPDTIKRVDELLRLIQERGPQKDAAASEMFDAVISTLYEARDHIDFSAVPKRGRWGTPTASAFVAALGKSFGR